MVGVIYFTISLFRIFNLTQEMFIIKTENGEEN